MNCPPDPAALLAPGAAPERQLAAAAALLGSEDAANVRLAEALALQAMRALPQARPLAAAAYDRLRLLAGRPQKYGVWPLEGGPRSAPGVEPATTDSERAKWGLPALRELMARGLLPLPWA